MSIRYIVLFMGIVSITGCATTWSEQKCHQLNWYNLGVSDGSKGLNRIDYYAQKCAQTSIKPNALQYQQGVQEGIFTGYCTVNHFASLGQKNIPFKPICPANQMPQLTQAYNEAKKQAHLEKVVTNAEQELNHLHQKLTTLDQQLKSETDHYRKQQLLQQKQTSYREFRRTAGELYQFKHKNNICQNITEYSCAYLKDVYEGYRDYYHHYR